MDEGIEAYSVQLPHGQSLVKPGRLPKAGLLV